MAHFPVVAHFTVGTPKLKRTGVANGNCVVYGVLSDGDKFLFVSRLYCSREFDVMNSLPEILQHVRNCLAVVATSSPTSSPKKIRVGAKAVVVPPVDVTVQEEEEELDFAGLQKRVFRFKTGEYEVRDILRWLKEA